MKHFYICLLLSFTFLFSCTQPKKEFIRHDRLINYDSKIIYPVDSFYALDEETFQSINSTVFNLKTDTIKYLKDRIYVSYLTVLPDCAQYEGNIKIYGDTIKLLAENISDMVCTAQNGWRLVFEIKNNKGKKYIIQKY